MRNRNKSNRNTKEAKLSQFEDSIILYLKDPKDSTGKFLDLRNTFSKLAEYKIYIQKSVVFLYTSNEPAKKEVRKEKSHSQYHKK